MGSSCEEEEEEEEETPGRELWLTSGEVRQDETFGVSGPRKLVGLEIVRSVLSGITWACVHSPPG